MGFDESESVSAVSDSLHLELWLSWDGTSQRLIQSQSDDGDN